MRILSPQAKRFRGFSLFELLMVLSIMSILGGISLAGLAGIHRYLARQETLHLFHELQTAFRMYRMENGSWPDCLGEGAIFLNGKDTGWREAVGPYLERDLGSGVLEDGFGNTRLLLAVDLNWDHWIDRDEVPDLGRVPFPDKVHDRVVILSLDRDGKLAVGSWEDD